MNDKDMVLKYDYTREKKVIHPAQRMVKNWVFNEGEETEACAAHYLAEIAEKGGLTNNDMQRLFPAILRMLKSKSSWAD